MPPVASSVTVQQPATLRTATWWVGHLLQPVAFVAGIAGWLVFRDRVGPMLPIGILGLYALLATWLERWMPMRPAWRWGLRDAMRDFFYIGGSILLWGPLDQLITHATLVLLRSQLGATGVRMASMWPSGMPLFVRLALVWQIHEFCLYWFHRAQHNHTWLWRLHSAHHAPATMSWGKSSINHPLETPFLALVTLVPTAMLGAGRIESEGAFLIFGLTTVFSHANIRTQRNAFGWLFTTNQHHFRHHARVVADGNSNYGCSTLLWDRLFGTFADSVGTAPATVAIGLDDGTELTLLQQLWLPFRREKRVVPR